MSYLIFKKKDAKSQYRVKITESDETIEESERKLFNFICYQI